MWNLAEHIGYVKADVPFHRFDSWHKSLFKLRHEHLREALYYESQKTAEEKDRSESQGDFGYTMKNFPCHCMKCNKLKYQDIMDCLMLVRKVMKKKKYSGFGTNLAMVLTERLKE
jgi:hypothetical protein